MKQALFDTTENWSYLVIPERVMQLRDPQFSIRARGNVEEPYLVDGAESKSEGWNTPPVQYSKNGALYIAAPYGLLRQLRRGTYSVALRETKEMFDIVVGKFEEPTGPDAWQLDERPVSVRLAPTRNWLYLRIENLRSGVDYAKFWLRPRGADDQWLREGRLQSGRSYNTAPQLIRLTDTTSEAALPSDVIAGLALAQEWEVGFDGNPGSAYFSASELPTLALDGKGWLRDGRPLDVELHVENWVYVGIVAGLRPERITRFALATCGAQPQWLAGGGRTSTPTWLEPPLRHVQGGRVYLAVPKAELAELQHETHWDVQVDGLAEHGLLEIRRFTLPADDSAWQRDWGAVPASPPPPPPPEPQGTATSVDKPVVRPPPPPVIPARAQVGLRSLPGALALLIACLAGAAAAFLLLRAKGPVSAATAPTTDTAQLAELQALRTELKETREIVAAFYDPRYLRAALGTPVAQTDMTRLDKTVEDCERSAARGTGERPTTAGGDANQLRLSLAHNFPILRGDCVYRFAKEQGAPEKLDEMRFWMFSALRSGRRLAAARLAESYIGGASNGQRPSTADKVFAFKLYELAAILGAMEEGGRLVAPKSDTVRPYINTLRQNDSFSLVPKPFAEEAKTRMNEAFPP